MGFRKVLCSADSLLVVQLMQAKVPHHHRNTNDLEIIKEYLSRDWQCSISHTFREGNQCANILAKIELILEKLWLS